jgi:hypothetical protein
MEKFNVSVSGGAPMKTRRAFVLAIVVAVVGINQFARTQPAHIAGATPRPVAEGTARAAGHMNPAQVLRLSLVLQPHDTSDLDQFLRDVHEPSSPKFHRYLTFEQWKAQYGPSDADVARVRAWARRAGLTVIHEFRNNLALKVEASADTIEQAFSIRLNQYETGTRHFFSNDRDPTIAPEVAGVLKDVQGLNSFDQMHSMRSANAADDDQPIYKPGPFVTSRAGAAQGRGWASSESTGTKALSSISSGGTFGNNIEATDLYSSEAYDVAGLRRFSQCCNPNNDPGGSPRETAIAIIGANSFDPGDLTAFANQYGMATNWVQHMYNSPSCCDDEMTLDVEWSTAFANNFGNGANTARVLAYEGGGSHLSDLLDAWDGAHSDDNARNASTSFGGSEGDFGGLGNPSISDFTDIINAMASEGWSMAAAAAAPASSRRASGRRFSRTCALTASGRCPISHSTPATRSAAIPAAPNSPITAANGSWPTGRASPRPNSPASSHT